MNTLVLCFGEVLWDAFGDGKKAGGAPMNVAMNLNKQGISALMASSIGCDAEGEELMANLRERHLDTQLIQRESIFPTCLVAVKLDENQHATYIIPEPVSWDNIKPCRELHEKAATASALVFGSLACRRKTNRATLKQLLELPLLKIFDVNLRAPHYEISTINTLALYADILKMNEDELNLISARQDLSQEEKIQDLQQRFKCHTICVTLGEAGAIVLHHNHFHRHAGFQVEVADTVGAGDAFLAGFIAGLLRKEPMDKVLENASAAGAYVASQRGANPDYTLEDLQQFTYQKT